MKAYLSVDPALVLSKKLDPFINPEALKVHFEHFHLPVLDVLNEMAKVTTVLKIFRKEMKSL